MRFRTALLFFTSAVISFGLVSCNRSDNSELVLSETNLVLDRYAEYDISILNYEGLVSWATSDESLITVSDNGHLSCQGKVGDAVITATSGNREGKCTVSIKNQMKSPTIYVEDVVGFADAAVEFEPKVRYDDNYYPLVNYTLVSSDISVCRIDNQKEMFGAGIGSAVITIEGTWKTRELTSKTFNVEIKQSTAILLEKSEFDIYSVDDTSTAKENTVTIDGTYYEKGKAVEAALSVALDENDYLTCQGNKITVSKPYEESQPLEIAGKVFVDRAPNVSEHILVHLHPNYLEKDGMDELVKQPSAKLNIEKTNFGGRENVVKYEIAKDSANENPNNPTWSNWASRVEFYETTTKNGVSAYNYLVESGFNVLAFDFCYTGKKGFLMGSYGKGANSYFYNDIQTNNNDIYVVNSEGHATNTVVENVWMTAYIKIKNVVQKSMEAGQDAATLYISSCYVGDIMYLDNIRYYYDFAKINSVDIAFDRLDSEIIPDSLNENKGLADNEMFIYGPTFVQYSKLNDNHYSYVSLDESDPLRIYKNKISPKNLITGKAINEGYKYLSFKYRYISGNPTLYVYDLSKTQYVTFSLKPETEINHDLVKMFKDGKPVNKFDQGDLIDVVVRIDQTANESMYLTTVVASEFEIADFAYYKNESFYDELSQNDLIRVFSTDIDLCFANQRYDLRDLLQIMYGSSIREDYDIEDIALSNTDIAAVDGTIVTLKSEGELAVSFRVVIENQEKEHSIKFNIVKDNYVTIFNDDLELYCGSTANFTKTAQLNISAVRNQTALEISELTLELVNNSGIVSISSSGLVTGVKAGTDTIKVSFEYNGTLVFDTVDVVVFDTYRKGAMIVSKSDTNNPAKYEKVEGKVGGLSDVYEYSASVASWNNHLDVEETNHNDRGVSYQNIVNKPIKYITYDLMLTEGTTGRIACVSPAGKHVNLKLEAGKEIQPATEENDNIKFYSADGTETRLLKANTWYKVVINYSNFEAEFNNQFSTVYTCNEFAYVRGTMYFHDIRYYHEALSDADMHINL